MDDWLGYLRLTAKAKTGIGENVLVSGVIVAGFGFATILWLSIALFLWLSIRFDNQALAGLVVAAIFLAIALGAAIAIVVERRRARQRAQAALEARRAAALTDPTLLTVGLQIGQAIGWRRVAALGGIALLAAGLAKEWGAHENKPPSAPDEPPPAG